MKMILENRIFWPKAFQSKRMCLAGQSAGSSRGTGHSIMRWISADLLTFVAVIMTADPSIAQKRHGAAKCIVDAI